MTQGCAYQLRNLWDFKMTRTVSGIEVMVHLFRKKMCEAPSFLG